MSRVVIDGIEYAPIDEGRSGPRIGVAVKTRNRNEVAAKSVKAIRDLVPAGTPVIVVDDCSDKPVADSNYRFDKNVGIARASNKCLELLVDAGCEHLFLFDDDTYPLVADWWRPYVECPEPHLMWIFDKPKGATKRQVETIYEGGTFTAYHATRGCMLYVERRVLDVVGGMDPAFGKWGWEHQSWSDRIHAAGLTTARYMDVPNSGELIYSMDQQCEVESTATEDAKRYSSGPGMELRMESRHSPRYIEYRELDDVVMTCLLTDQPDPQRGKKLPSEAAQIADLEASLIHEGRFVVLHTGMTGKTNAEQVEVTQGVNVYFERWLQYYLWLRDNPKVGRVWCVDGTDVKMTRNPFPEMEPGRLYFGYEPTTLRDEWMLKSHPDATLQAFMKENANLPLLNMGVVGGDRETVMDFAQRVTKFFFDDYIDWLYGWETKQVGVGDMAAGNYVARTMFADVIDSGPHVTNVFKSEKPSATAWFKHK